MDVVYQVSGPDIVFENFDGDLVVLDLASGRYFGFNSTAAAVWAALMAEVTVAELVNHGIGKEELDVFVEKLMEFGLIKPGSTGVGGVVLDAELISKLENEKEAPAVEIYEDLADLITADPIHDVDSEAGWPHLP